MDYKSKYEEQLSKYDALKKQYLDMTSSSEYEQIIVSMPFELLSAKHTYEILELFKNLTTKPKIKFTSVEEAEVLYNSLKTFPQKSKELLDCASYIVTLDSLVKEINDFVKESPYLTESLMIEEKQYLSDIAKDCLENIPEGQKLITMDFRYNYIESCLYCLSKEDLARLVSENMIKSSDLDHISLSGNEQYEENLKYLCFLTNHKKIIEKSFELRLKGVKFENEDGSSRQSILKDMKTAKKEGKEIKLETKKYVYTPPVGLPEPAVGIYWEGKCIGNLPAPVSKEIEENFINSQLSAEFKDIVGGSDTTYYGCEITLNVIASKLNREMIENNITELENKKKEIENIDSEDKNKKLTDLENLLKTKKKELEKLTSYEKEEIS